jgi:tetratricopeptide (TPR) repeat protein
MCKEMRAEASGLRCAFVAALIASVVVFFAFARAASAQGSNFAASRDSNSFVSVRELQAPAKADNEFRRGLERLRKGDPKSSLAHFAAALEDYPSYYQVYYHKGIAEMALGDNDAALESFQKAIDLSEGRYVRAEFGYALTLCRQGKVAEAERVVRHGLQTDPNIADGHVVLGLVLLQSHRFEEAEKSARKALELNAPSSGKAYLILADVAAEKGNYEERAKDFDLYLRRYPDEPNKGALHVARDIAKRLAIENRSKAPETATRTDASN